MRYISFIQALNIEDKNTECCGDWHCSGQDWQNLTMADTRESIFGEWGIEKGVQVPEHEELYAVANVMRACLDIMQTKYCGFLVGFRNDFFCTDKYNNEFMGKVMELNGNVSNWEEIDQLMTREFMGLWDKFKEVKKHR